MNLPMLVGMNVLIAEHGLKILMMKQPNVVSNMALRNYLKKLSKRAAGCWGRVNHKKDMRTASKAVRKQGKLNTRNLK